MAETLEEIRKHVEELIRRLSEVESAPAQKRPEPPRAEPMGVAALAELETSVVVLGAKVDQAGNLLAQVTDLLESQAERLETLEMQVGEPQTAWPSARDTGHQEHVAPVPEPEPAPAPTSESRAAVEADLVVMVSELLRSVRAEIGSLATELRERVQGLDGRVSDLQQHFEESRRLVWQHRNEMRDLEERLLTLAEASMRENPESEEVPKLGIAPAAAVPTEVRPTSVVPISIPPTASVGLSGAPGLAPVPASTAATAHVVTSAAEPAHMPEAEPMPPMDARTVRRLEELVEREVRLQQEFSPGAVATNGRRSRPSVMVVDDLPDARKILSIYLSRTGYQVVTASGAEDCLAKLRHHEVDAVVLDASMPGGGGAQVCRTLREDAMYAAKRHLPVIIYTSYPDEYPPSVVDAWGATDYVVKGGDMLPLITALVRHTKENQDALP